MYADHFPQRDDRKMIGVLGKNKKKWTGQTDRQTDRQTGRQTDRQTDRLIDRLRQTDDRQTDMQISFFPYGEGSDRRLAAPILLSSLRKKKQYNIVVKTNSI